MKLKNKLHDINSLTVHVFDEICKTENLFLLGKGTKSQLFDQWALINDEIENVVGVSDNYKDYINCKITALEHFQAAMNGEKWRIILGQIEEIKAKEISESFGESKTQSEILLILCKSTGLTLRKYDTTISELLDLYKLSSNGKSS